MSWGRRLGFSPGEVGLLTYGEFFDLISCYAIEHGAKKHIIYDDPFEELNAMIPENLI